MESIYFVLGACLASFIMCLANRMNRQASLKGFSYCDHCGKRLLPINLIPIISWLIFLGKCRSCKHHISLVYPLTELSLAVIFLSASANYVFLIICCLFLFLSCEDLYDHSAHVFILYPIILFELCRHCSKEKVIAGIILLALLLFFVYCRQTLGFGDLPVIILIYLNTTHLQFLMVIMLASGLAILIFLHQQEKQLAFIPFLTIAYVLIKLIV